jgi:hypothetical protein
MNRERSTEEKRLHDLRNAANTVMLSVVVAKRLLETGEGERALGFLSEAEHSCKKFRELLGNEAGIDSTASP